MSELGAPLPLLSEVKTYISRLLRLPGSTGTGRQLNIAGTPLVFSYSLLSALLQSPSLPPSPHNPFLQVYTLHPLLFLFSHWVLSSVTGGREGGGSVSPRPAYNFPTCNVQSIVLHALSVYSQFSFLQEVATHFH